jgi:CheY-like chemotaxis protein
MLLLVDDAPEICELAQAILGVDGFRVLTASDGTMGVALFRQHAEKIRAVRDLGGLGEQRAAPRRDVTALREWEAKERRHTDAAKLVPRCHHRTHSSLRPLRLADALDLLPHGRRPRADPGQPVHGRAKLIRACFSYAPALCSK